MAIEQNDILDDYDPDGNFLDHVLPENMCQHLTVSELNDKNLNPDQFSLINYNICSFHKNIAQFESFLDSINTNFKCIVISETWNNESNTEMCKLLNYNDFHTIRFGEDV